MSSQTRRLLLLTGLALLVGGLLAVGYALWPISSGQATVTLAPTLFAPP